MEFATRGEAVSFFEWLVCAEVKKIQAEHRAEPRQALRVGCALAAKILKKSGASAC